MENLKEQTLLPEKQKEQMNMEEKKMSMEEKEVTVAEGTMTTEIEVIEKADMMEKAVDNMQTTVPVIEKYKTIDVKKTFTDNEYVIGNALKLMPGKYGGGFYVSYIQDVGSKMGNLVLTIEYPDEQIERVFLAKNCFIILEDENEDGIARINNSRGEIVPKLSESMGHGDYRILEKYETPNMPIPSRILWKLIIENYEKIPVVRVYRTESFDEIYWRLYEIVKEEQRIDITSNRENDVVFYVTKDEIEKVAIECGWTFAKLRTELNMRGMLVKDKPVYDKDGICKYRPYQLTKKIDGKNMRFYAIRKKIDVPVMKYDRKCVTEYTEDFCDIETEADKRIRTLQDENRKLEMQNKEQAEQIRKLYLDRVQDTTSDEVANYLL